MPCRCKMINLTDARLFSILVTVAVTVVVAYAFLLGWLASASHYDTDFYSQSTFPCAEDEALVYAPQFGPDRVGCMHIEGGQLAPEVWERPIGR